MTLVLLLWLFCLLMHGVLCPYRGQDFAIGLPREGCCDFPKVINYPGRPSKADTIIDAQASLMPRASSSIRRWATPVRMASHYCTFSHDCLS